MVHAEILTSPEERKLDLLFRTAPRPLDANGDGDIFGGWIMSQMDISAGILAGRRARGRVATVAVTGMTFLKPVFVGDVVSIWGEIAKTGRTSVTIHLETWAERPRPRDGRPGEYLVKVTEATFVMVALDHVGVPRPLDETGPDRL